MELGYGSLAQRFVRFGMARARSREGAAAAAPSAFDSAIEHFAHGRWPAAFGALVPLADAGHPAAARIAMLMTTRGPRLFGQAFAASAAQRERWQRIVDAGAAARTRLE